jgi:hypothetical protein
MTKKERNNAFSKPRTEKVTSYVFGGQESRKLKREQAFVEHCEEKRTVSEGMERFFEAMYKIENEIRIRHNRGCKQQTP